MVDRNCSIKTIFFVFQDLDKFSSLHGYFLVRLVGG